MIRSIDDYVNGKLGMQEVDALWIQLLRYPEYYRYLKTQAALKKQYRKNHTPHNIGLGRKLISASTAPWIATAAALLLVFLLYSIFRITYTPQINPVMNEINLLHLISPDVTRSSTQESLSEEEQLLQNAFSLSIAGDINRAIGIYKSLEEDEHYRNTVLFNQGILYYNVGNYSDAVSAFNQTACRDFSDNLYTEQCFWFLTNSYIAIEEFERARETAQQTRASNGIYRNDADVLLKRLEKHP